MNRGFNYYFREGVKSSAKALFRNKNYLRYFVYFIMEILSRLFLIFGPIFDLANVRQGSLIWKRRRIDVSQSFRNAGNPHSVWTYVLTVLVESLMFLAGILLIGVFTALLAAVGYGISQIASNPDSKLFIGIFSVPGAALLLVYLVIMPLILAPTAYIIAENPGIGVGDTLSICFNTMKANGKWTLFLSMFIPALIKGLCAVALCLSTYFLWDALKDSDYSVLVIVLWGIITLSGYAIVAPIFTLASRSATHHLFQDIMLDKIGGSKTVKGINIKKCNGQMFRPEEIESNMVSMFDETDADAYDTSDGGAKTNSASPQPRVNLADAYEYDPAKKPRKKQTEKSAEEPVAAETAAPETEPAAQPADTPLTEPMSEPAEEPVAAETVAPETEPVVQSAEEPAAQPAETPAEPAVRPTPQPEPQPQKQPEYDEEEGELVTLSDILGDAPVNLWDGEDE